MYVWARRGRNEVFAGGAVDAAYGELSPPGSDGAVPQRATALVPDDRMDELATIEFVPPKGSCRGKARHCSTSSLDDGSVEAWLSGLAGREAIELEQSDGKLSIGSGRRRGELDGVDAALLDRFLAEQDPYVTGTYDKDFAAAWSEVAGMQRAAPRLQRVVEAPATRRRLGRGGGGGGKAGFGLVTMIVFIAVWAGSATTAFLGVFRSWPAALVLGLVFPAIVAYFVYRVLLPSRSAQGSALALRAESFRRFLHASEAQHVEWAWQHDLLREYSGWAVALGEADAWSSALARANVPEPARVSAMPALLVAHSASSIRSSRVPPSSSGSGGGSSGGFSGGSVGGGGGGGSRGSW